MIRTGATPLRLASMPIERTAPDNRLAELVAHLTGGAGADGVRPDGPGAPPTAEADGGDGTCGLAAPGPAARAARR